VKRYLSPYGTVTLTDERLAHILESHPDVGRCLKYFKDALAAPERVVPSVHDTAVFICYRSIPRSRKLLAVVIKIGRAPFVLTAYLAKKPKKGTM